MADKNKNTMKSKVKHDPCLTHVLQLVAQIKDLKYLHLTFTEHLSDLTIKVYLKHLKVYFLFHCFISGKLSKDPNHPDVPSVYSFKKNTGKKKKSFNWFEGFTKRQARSLDSDDKKYP